MNHENQERGHITPANLKRRIDHGERFQLIDVRSAREFGDGHLPGSVNLPLDQVESRLSDLHPQDPAVLVCFSGHRAGMCRDMLSRHRNDLTVLEGGAAAWIRDGFPVVKSTRTRVGVMRQVQLTVGFLALAGSLLGYFGDRSWNFLPMFVGAGLFVAGLTGFCGMASLLALMPWNRGSRAPSTVCSQ